MLASRERGSNMRATRAPTCQTVYMSFGQQSGPPASVKQVTYLLSLLEADGYDFATGRHHYGLTQRQAKGKFSVAEASEMIDMLVAKAEAGPDDPHVMIDLMAKKVQETIDTQRATLLRGIPAEVLADELERRGWAVIPPV